MDILKIGSLTVNAGDFFNTSNSAFPVSDCTGVTAGASVIDSSISGAPAIGVVATCNSQSVVFLTAPSAVASSGANDSLLGSLNLPGQIVLNPNPKSWVGIIGEYFSDLNGIYPYPFGQISGDTSGVTWPTGTPTYASYLPTCNATHNVGMNAMIADGIVSPTYLQVASGGGSSNRKVFCDGTAWLYD
jgi:hypothetical protein